MSIVVNRCFLVLMIVAVMASITPARPGIQVTSIEPGQLSLHIQKTHEQEVPGLDVEVKPSLWVAVPPDTRHLEVSWSDPAILPLSVSCDQLAVVRGIGLAPLNMETLLLGRENARLTITHDGSWFATKSAPRRYGRSLDQAVRAGVVGLPPQDRSTENGAYVIVTTPDFRAAADTLAAWKRRKGLPTTVAEFGPGTDAAVIKTWLQEAYDTWPVPPEYVLLLGDVDRVETFIFSGNATDLPFTLLDGDDWLPDALVGRFSAETFDEAMTLVNKTITYEREPAMADPGWCTRGLYVAGQYGSTTPMHTVRFCGEQLQSIGFEGLNPVTPEQLEGNFIVSPYQISEGIGIPMYQGSSVISAAINTGCSFIVYRGWARGTSGWEFPEFVIEHLPSLTNDSMLPVVLDFVCLTGDFSTSTPCFGEVFTRSGEPQGPYRGAIAHFGSSEHWTHTRHNDALAIATFECVTDVTIADLGSLLLAGRLRFLEYFPHKLDCEDNSEDCAEFYFHVYNLLGDPELDYKRAVPSALTATHAAQLDPAANYLEVSVHGSGGAGVAEGCRVGVVQDDILLGGAFTDDQGIAVVPLDGLGEGPALDLTISHPRFLTYESTVDIESSAAFLTPTTLTWSDAGSQSQGNGDGVVNPGETLEVAAVIHNHGEESASQVSAHLSSEDLEILVDQVTCADVPPASSIPLDSPFVVTVPATARDGAILRCKLSLDHDGGQSDTTLVDATVSAPDLINVGVTLLAGGDGDALFEPGETCAFSLALLNAGSAGTTGFQAVATLLDPSQAELISSEAEFGEVNSGEAVDNDNDPFEIQLSESVPLGSMIDLAVSITTDEGYFQDVACRLSVGVSDSTTITGPDQYGYIAIDSHDTQYPDLRPEYVWQEISTEYGGPGTALTFDADNRPTDLVVNLPFTFRFYGLDYTSIRISDNGWISFDTTDSYDFYNLPIPTLYGNGALIAPFWDELDPVPDDPAQGFDGVYYWYDEASHAFIVEWSRLPHMRDWEAQTLQTFQVVLHDPVHYPTSTADGEILFYYASVNDNDSERRYATIGIEAPTEDDGLQYRFAGIAAPGAGTPGSGFAIRLTTQVPQIVTTVDLETVPESCPNLSVHPNPFNPLTTIAFHTIQAERLQVGIYDLRGRQVVRLVDRELSIGRHTVTWTGQDDRGQAVSSGVYLVRLQGAQRIETRRIALVR